MRVLVVFAHPVETSYQAALHRKAVEKLQESGHDVDDCDLYAEGFNPVLSREERLGYHDQATNRQPIATYVERLLAADALVLVFPVWNFGFPAILKGFFDRVFLPGVSFDMDNGMVVPCLDNIGRILAITTYGGARWRAFGIGDPPRKIVTRLLRNTVRRGATVDYLAHYDMNRSTPETRQRFLTRVETHLATF